MDLELRAIERAHAADPSLHGPLVAARRRAGACVAALGEACSCQACEDDRAAAERARDSVRKELAGQPWTFDQDQVHFEVFDDRDDPRPAFAAPRRTHRVYAKRVDYGCGTCGGRWSIAEVEGDKAPTARACPTCRPPRMHMGWTGP